MYNYHDSHHLRVFFFLMQDFFFYLIMMYGYSTDEDSMDGDYNVKFVWTPGTLQVFMYASNFMDDMDIIKVIGTTGLYMHKSREHAVEVYGYGRSGLYNAKRWLDLMLCCKDWEKDVMWEHEGWGVDDDDLAIQKKNHHPLVTLSSFFLHASMFLESSTSPFSRSATMDDAKPGAANIYYFQMHNTSTQHILNHKPSSSKLRATIESTMLPKYVSPPLW